jgi:Ulp1 family protease
MYELAISKNDMNRLRQLFSPHRNDNELAAKCTPAGSRARYEQVQCGNFRDLNSREWLNDEIINFMLRGYIENFADNIGCFNSFFMGNLLGMNGRGAPERDIPPWSPTGYYYDAVQTWHNRFQSGLFNLEHLFVPINVGQAHWNFIHVRPREKIIELYDSYGVRESNQIYLTQFARYMHQLYRDVHGGSTVSYGSWAEEWTILDASANSPVQSDNYNCGVFVILSAYLLSLGHQLRRGSYTTQMIEDNETRLKIAHLICKGDNRSEGGTCENKNGGKSLSPKRSIYIFSPITKFATYFPQLLKPRCYIW